MGANMVAMSGMVQAFTGYGHGVSVGKFVGVLEQIRKKFKMVGNAYDFAWFDDEVKGASTLAEYKRIPLSCLIMRFGAREFRSS